MSKVKKVEYSYSTIVEFDYHGSVYQFTFNTNVLEQAWHAWTAALDHGSRVVDNRTKQILRMPTNIKPPTMQDPGARTPPKHIVRRRSEGGHQ